MTFTKYSFLVLLLVVTIFGLGCSAQKQSNSGDSEGEYISFGSLGGFAGSYKESRIYRDGNVFTKNKFDGDFYAQKSIPDSNVKQLFATIEGIRSTHNSLNDPGNLSYFIKWSKKGSTQLEYIWGGENLSTPQLVKSYYQLLKSMCVDDNPVR